MRGDAEESTSRNIEVLRKASHLAQIGEETLLELAAVATPCRFKKGDFIFREQDPSTFFYIITEGRVKNFKISASGKQLVANVGSPGETLNAVVLFSGNPHFLSAQALDDTVLLQVKREDYVSIVSKDKGNLLRLITLLEQALGSAYERLLDAVSERAEQRVHNILYMLYEKFGPILDFSREEISELSGTTTETVVRTLAGLKQLEIVKLGRRKIYVIDDVKLGRLNRSHGSSPGRI